jgi:sulfur-oxidizing protein SoxX
MKNMSIHLRVASLSLSALLTAGVCAAADTKSGQAALERDFQKAAKSSFFLNTPAEFNRLNDPTLAICNATKDSPSGEQAMTILKREAKAIVYPKSGKLMGDWQKGQQWVEATHGGRIGVPGFKDADDPHHANGANCYACHAIAPNFPQAGNMGPPLMDYGRLRTITPELIKYTYDKVFNAKSLNPCSLMPRYGGASRLLTPEQVADIVAFLTSPDSPVNQGIPK